VIDGVVYSTELAAPPPSYDEALAMKRPETGDLVRFVVGIGEDAIVFEFSIPKNAVDDVELKSVGVLDDRCPPPRYCGRHAAAKTMLVDECGSRNDDNVVDPSASSPDSS